MIIQGEVERAKRNAIAAMRRVWELEKSASSGGQVDTGELARARAQAGKARMEYLNKQQEWDSPEMC